VNSAWWGSSAAAMQRMLLLLLLLLLAAACCFLTGSRPSADHLNNDPDWYKKQVQMLRHQSMKA